MYAARQSLPRRILTDGKTVAIHHANYARILSLRQTADALDNNIKSTLRLLAETRKELLDIPGPQSSNPQSRDVRVDELLSYAKFISKTTVPPTFRRPIPKDILSSGTQPSTVEDAPTQQQTQIANGMATPTAANPSTATDDTQPTTAAAAAATSNIGLNTLTQETKDMLDPLSKLPFVPWPSQDIIRMGALAAIQGMLEDGRDPASVLSAEEQAEEDKRKAEEEERIRREMEERDMRRRESFAMRGAGGGGVVAQEDVFDPDEA